MWTDAAHRRCPKCKRRLDGVYDRQQHKLVEIDWDDGVTEGMYPLKGADADGET